MLKYDIPIRGSSGRNHKIKKKFTKTYLYKMYITNNYSTVRIAKLNRCEPDTVRKYLKKFNIAIKEASWWCKGKNLSKKHKQKISKAHKGKILTEQHKEAIRVATSKHHIDGNHANNTPDNVIIVTNSTHQKMDSIYYKFIKKIKQDDQLKRWLKKNYTNK